MLCVAGNSAYGRTLVNLESHTDIMFCELDDTTASNFINNSRFSGLQEIGEGLVEIQSRKAKVKLNVPVQIGFFVLEYAKLALLRFYYDFLLKFLPMDSFCLIEADTDALYLALSKSSLYMTVKVELRSEFVEEHDKWLAREYCDEHKSEFFSRVFNGYEWNPIEECCQTSAKYYKRSAGLFHCENISKGVVALCSKCYYCFGKDRKYS